jgi:exopolysaccharide biosynthesis polyprenyl glycosylphosphotransferase
MDYSVVSDFNNFTAFLRNNVVDEVVISLPMKSLYDQASRIVALCEEQGIIVRFLSDIFDLKFGRSEAEQFEEDSVITVSTGAMEGWQVLAKRVFDFITSLILLAVLSPLFIIIAVLIKFKSSGPIFFTQLRPGLNKRPFRMIKFRTMVKDADEIIDRFAHLNQESGPAFKIKNDPRITSIGKLLRRASVDELPQLINVLKGEMSLVGPRPLFYWEFERINEDWIKRRCSVKPGITGLWQVNGRSNLAFDKRILIDLEYIDNWSLGLDFSILLKTLPAVLFSKGAV